MGHGCGILDGIDQGKKCGFDSNNFGQTLFALANEMCDYFETCVSSGKAHTSDSFVDDLNTVGTKDINVNIPMRAIDTSIIINDGIESHGYD
eukprot:12256431-Ditylum_brightwellii.AAC.1